MSVSIYTPKKDQRGPAWSYAWRQRKEEAEKSRLARLHIDLQIKMMKAMADACQFPSPIEKGEPEDPPSET